MVGRSAPLAVMLTDEDGDYVGSSGGGGGAATVADGADVAQGAVADAVVAAGAAGTLSAKLRRLTTDIDAIKTLLSTQAGYLDGIEALLPITNVVKWGGVAVDPLAANAAHDASAASVPPILVGGYAKATAPAAVSTTGDAVQGWYTLKGEANTQITCDGAIILGDATNGLDVDVTRLPAGENFLGTTGLAGDVLSLTPTISTSLYTVGFVLFDTTAIANFFRLAGGRTRVTSLVVNDKSALGIGFDLYFLNANNAFAAANAAATISDANLDAVIGRVEVDAADFTTVSGAKIAVIGNIGRTMKGITTSCYAAAITRGAPTYGGASDLVLKIGVEFL